MQFHSGTDQQKCREKIRTISFNPIMAFSQQKTHVTVKPKHSAADHTEIQYILGKDILFILIANKLDLQDLILDLCERT